MHWFRLYLIIVVVYPCIKNGSLVSNKILLLKSISFYHFAAHNCLCGMFHSVFFMLRILTTFGTKTMCYQKAHITLLFIQRMCHSLQILCIKVVWRQKFESLSECVLLRFLLLKVHMYTVTAGCKSNFTATFRLSIHVAHTYSAVRVWNKRAKYKWEKMKIYCKHC